MTSDELKQIWPEWEIEEKPLGKGSFGVVYKAVRRDYNVESFAAIKVISIPSDPSEVDSLRSEGLDLKASKTLLRSIVDDFVNEIRMMETLKGVPNIVNVEDYKVVEKTDEIGWDIYIRMELLKTFNVYICDKKLTEKEVIKLGCDICTALEICGQRNIIHRDIKPENIFVNNFGYFKLGDFGIARKLENMTGSLSQKGTFNYMAPEVAEGNKYDSRVDTYSLGIVLYRLLNGNRLPFLDTEKQLLNHNERENALNRRLRGEALPAPCDASPAMADIILRACAYDPNARFSSATEMKQALTSAANGTYSAMGKVVPDSTVSDIPEPSIGPIVNTFGLTPGSNTKSSNKVNIPSIALTASVVCAVVIFAIAYLPKDINKPATSNLSQPVSSSPAPSVVSTEPVETTVTILDVEYDIATTTWLSLRDMGITDAQLAQIVPNIAKLTNLTSLNLSENQIGDITPLARLTNLTSLQLSGNPISADDIEHLKAQLPYCDISN